MGTRKTTNDDLIPVYGKDGKVKYWTEKDPEGDWMKKMGLTRQASRNKKLKIKTS